MAKGPTRRAARPQADDGRKVVAQNRRARHDYEVIETVEAGIELVGSEVKSLREGKAQLRDAYARVEGGEMWLMAMHIPPWVFATGFGAHDPERRRRLLLHKRQIVALGDRVAREGLTLVPLSVYFRDGKAKVALALARGRKTYDKRHALAERDARREAERALSVRGRG
ncbi:MAG TPA: SsrA-binding protein SmpB [Acidimicrobiales bacterium]|nr:SsrA-binding protein SmpB [Acidimicrobiales bacterium]